MAHSIIQLAFIDLFTHHLLVQKYEQAEALSGDSEKICHYRPQGANSDTTMTTSTGIDGAAIMCQNY